MEIVARIYTDFDEKFGIPRQSSLVPELYGRIVFEPAYRDLQMLKGLEGFSWIWLIWQFDRVPEGKWSPTVRPPKLGGNRHMGVFATRSPFRPNPIGLSSVRLEKILPQTPDGPVIIVSGADIVNGTPIYDIKPYIAYSDSHPEALGGFTEEVERTQLEVIIPEDLLCKIPEEKRPALMGVLAQDPRPG